jgi:hypothetical protein
LYDTDSFYYISRIIVAINSLTSPVSAIGNGLVLMAIVKNPSLRTPDNILIGSLALADFLIGAVIQPMLTALVVNRNLYLSCLYVDSYTLITFGCGAVSVTFMAAVSYERYVALFFPMRYPTLVNNTRAFIVAAGVLILWIAIMCVLSKSVLFGQVIAGTVWFASCFAIAFSYFKILLLVRHHRRQSQSQQAAVSPNTDTASQTKLAITMGYVIGVSLASYIPAASFCEVYLSVDQSNPTLFNTVFVVLAVQLTSSCFNPIVNFWRRRDIRQPTVAMLRSIFRRLF